jgi:hypothetical protein
MIDFSLPLESETGLPIKLSKLHHPHESSISPYNQNHWILEDVNYRKSDSLIRYFFCSADGIIVTDTCQAKFGRISNKFSPTVVEDWRL